MWMLDDADRSLGHSRDTRGSAGVGDDGGHIDKRSCIFVNGVLGATRPDVVLDLALGFVGIVSYEEPKQPHERPLPVSIQRRIDQVPIGHHLDRWGDVLT